MHPLVFLFSFVFFLTPFTSVGLMSLPSIRRKVTPDHFVSMYFICSSKKIFTDTISLNELMELNSKECAHEDNVKATQLKQNLTFALERFQTFLNHRGRANKHCLPKFKGMKPLHEYMHGNDFSFLKYFFVPGSHLRKTLHDRQKDVSGFLASQPLLPKFSEKLSQAIRNKKPTSKETKDYLWQSKRARMIYKSSLAQLQIDYLPFLNSLYVTPLDIEPCMNGIPPDRFVSFFKTLEEFMLIHIQRNLIIGLAPFIKVPSFTAAISSTLSMPSSWIIQSFTPYLELTINMIRKHIKEWEDKFIEQSKNLQAYLLRLKSTDLKLKQYELRASNVFELLNTQFTFFESEVQKYKAQLRQFLKERLHSPLNHLPRKVTVGEDLLLFLSNLRMRLVIYSRMQDEIKKIKMKNEQSRMTESLLNLMKLLNEWEEALFYIKFYKLRLKFFHVAN